jgi:hypothetical protein
MVGVARALGRMDEAIDHYRTLLAEGTPIPTKSLEEIEKIADETSDVPLLYATVARRASAATEPREEARWLERLGEIAATRRKDVGAATGLGLWLAGVPAAWAIGLVAGLAEFVPYLGIFVAVLPAVVLGFAQGTETGLWTIGILVVVQQLQGNVVMPIVQNHMVDLPPAITIFGIIAAGILFGLPGVLLATPLTIVVLVLVRRLYLEEDKHEVLSSGDASATSFR